ncbi:hypothetical protein BJ742DRAFT_341570 [Cladochytrium replicatum]|nr:hypothetical protein BJ742DRAFT_341570 [Cladochytrium replicatum]
MTCEWETALYNRNKLIICPLFVGVYDMNVGTTVPFNPSGINTLPPGRLRMALESLCQINGLQMIPEDVGSMTGFFEDRLRDWNSLASSLISSHQQREEYPPAVMTPHFPTTAPVTILHTSSQSISQSIKRRADPNEPSISASPGSFDNGTSYFPSDIGSLKKTLSNNSHHPGNESFTDTETLAAPSPNMKPGVPSPARKPSLNNPRPPTLQMPAIPPPMPAPPLQLTIPPPSSTAPNPKSALLSPKSQKKSLNAIFHALKGSRESSSGRGSWSSAATKTMETLPILVDVKNLDMMGPPPQYQERMDLRKFSWRSLSEAIIAGEMLVVGAGRYVYDISSWINLHPGGSLILNSVTGTDITNDFFNESTSFDSSHYVSEARSRTPSIRRHEPFKLNRVPSYAGTIRSESGINVNADTASETWSLEQQLRPSPISDDDWKAILNTRRIHRHSKSAVDKLVSFLVGEIVPEGPVPQGVDRVSLMNGDVRVFDPYEYRRYCMTRKTLLTPEGSPNPVYLLRFTLLYPHSDIRVNEPEDSFRPGQCVEIQVKTTKGQWVSRYYSPLSGNTRCFEIAVKAVPDGDVSTFLTSQKPGVKQTKISLFRGPFGSIIEPATIVKQSRHTDVPTFSKRQLILSGRSKFISRLIFISAGSGIAPFLQYINDTYLGVGKILFAFAPYSSSEPTSVPNLEIQPGDSIFVMHHYNDGWGWGFNLRTGQEGDFPASVLVPLSGLFTQTGARACLVNAVHQPSDIFGVQSLLPAVSAWPKQVSVTHVVSTPAADGVDERDDEETLNNCGGKLIQGRRLDTELLEKLVAEPYDEMKQDGGSVCVVVCGPVKFEQMVYDVLVDELGVLHEDITVLPPDVYWVVDSQR